MLGETKERDKWQCGSCHPGDLKIEHVAINFIEKGRNMGAGTTPVAYTAHTDRCPPLCLYMIKLTPERRTSPHFLPMYRERSGEPSQGRSWLPPAP
jgi:hypothetical protein